MIDRSRPKPHPGFVTRDYSAPRPPGRATLVEDDAKGGGELDPDAIHADQYAEGTNLRRANDCGPAVVLMVLRAVGAEPALRKKVAAWTGKPKVTLQHELDYIRGKVADARDPATAPPGAAVDTALHVGQVRNALILVLQELGVSLSKKQLEDQLALLSEDVAYMTPASDTKGAARKYIVDNARGGSAVIVLGAPVAEAWGWGGTDDPGRRKTASATDPSVRVPQTIPIQKGSNHFVLVWAGAPGDFTVLDPSWTTPREGQTIDDVMAFIGARGASLQINVMAVPFEELRDAMPEAAAPLPQLHLGKAQQTDPPPPPAGPIDAKLLAKVIAEHGKPGFSKAVQAVWTTCNASLPDPKATDAYETSPVEPTLKRATLGRLAAVRGRFEFLLGWMVQGGIQMKGSNWEYKDKPNRGSIVDSYTGAESGYGAGGGDWCGMFAGFAHRHTGMDKSSAGYQSMASAFKAMRFIRAGNLGTAGAAMTPEQIFSGAATPQPGDIVVFAEHVSMVERFDPATRRIDTIDGNIGLADKPGFAASNAASGRTYTQDHGTGKMMRILAVYRPGLEAWGKGATPAGATSTDNAAGEALVAHVDSACRQLVELYGLLKLPGAVSNDASVSEIAARTAG